MMCTTSVDDWAALPFALVDPLDDEFQSAPFEPFGHQIHAHLPEDLVFNVVAPLMHNHEDLLKAIHKGDCQMVQFLLKVPPCWSASGRKARLTAFKSAIFYSLKIFQILYKKDFSTVQRNWEALFRYAASKNRSEVIYFMLRDLKQADGVQLGSTKTKTKESKVFSRWGTVTRWDKSRSAVRNLLRFLNRKWFAWMVQDGAMGVFDHDVNAVCSVAVDCNNLEVVHHCMHQLGANVCLQFHDENMWVQEDRWDMALYLMVQGVELWNLWCYRGDDPFNQVLNHKLTPKVRAVIMEVVNPSKLDYHIQHTVASIAKVVHSMMLPHYKFDYVDLVIQSLEHGNIGLVYYFMTHIQRPQLVDRIDAWLMNYVHSCNFCTAIVPQSCQTVAQFGKGVHDWAVLDRCIEHNALNVPTIDAYYRVKLLWERHFNCRSMASLFNTFDDSDVKLSFDLREVFVREVEECHKVVKLDRLGRSKERYPSENPINRFVKLFHDDLCTLRRYLADPLGGREKRYFFHEVRSAQEALAKGQRVCNQWLNDYSSDICLQHDPHELCTHDHNVNFVNYKCALCNRDNTLQIRCRTRY